MCSIPLSHPWGRAGCSPFSLPRPFSPPSRMLMWHFFHNRNASEVPYIGEASSETPVSGTENTCMPSHLDHLQESGRPISPLHERATVTPAYSRFPIERPRNFILPERVGCLGSSALGQEIKGIDHTSNKKRARRRRTVLDYSLPRGSSWNMHHLECALCAILGNLFIPCALGRRRVHEGVYGVLVGERW